MRLDLFLKTSRLVTKRTLAQALCDAGAVSVNGLPAKSARIVHQQDEIILRRQYRLLTVRVKLVPTARQVARSEASSLYEVLSDAVLQPDLTEE